MPLLATRLKVTVFRLRSMKKLAECHRMAALVSCGFGTLTGLELMNRNKIYATDILATRITEVMYTACA